MSVWVFMDSVLQFCEQELGFLFHSWRRLPLAPLWSHQTGEPQTGEQLYQRSSGTVVKMLGPTPDFPTWGSKGTENLQGIWLSNPVGFDYRTSAGLGKQTWRAHTKPCAFQDPGERGNDPSRDWARLASNYLEVLVGAWIDRGLPQGWDTGSSGRYIMLA